LTKPQVPTASIVDKRDAQGRLRQSNLPPGPPGYSLLKLSEFQHQPIEYLGCLWREYGDLVRLPIMPGLTFFLAAHPDHAEHILAQHQERYGRPDLFLKSMGLLDLFKNKIVSQKTFC
jgi:hypothetical protein